MPEPLTVVNWIVPGVLGYSARSLLRYIREQRPLLKLWAPHISGGTDIIISEIPYLDEKSKKAMKVGGPIASANEAIALGELAHLFSKLGHKAFAFHSSGSDPDITQRNIVLIGGPINNPVTGRVLRRIDPPLLFSDHNIVDKTAQVTFSATKGKTDFGLIILAANPFCHGRKIMVLAGCYAPGTQAAAKAVAEPDLVRKIAKQYLMRDKNSVFVIRTDVEDGRATSPSIATPPRFF